MTYYQTWFGLISGSLIFFFLLLLEASPLLGQLRLPKVFSDHMVVQRESPIPIWGSGAEPGQTVAVELKNSSRETLADSIGSWSVKLPAISAGGPYDLQVATETDTINFTDVLVGEVWVASGQSNMAWPLRQSEVFDSVKSNLKHPDIRLFKMEQGVHLSPEPYTEEELRKIVHGSFYQSASWEHSSSDTAPEFSAVAYYFAQNLQDSLNVPVGIIQNAIGGSPTQAWLSKKALRNNPKLKKYIPGGEDNWFSVKELHPFIASRVKENLGEALKSGQVNAYQHPFAPFYLYDHGVTPLIPYGIRGVLWYQGESNANYPDEHTRLFKTLIQDWRKAWKQGSFPFLYVQLPAIQGRNRWPEFRKGQQDVLKLPNTSMTVTVDLGDPRRPSNVHPPKKRPIGRRLSRIALGKVYGESIPFSGPKFENYQLRDSILSITFDHAEKLATTNGNSPNGLVLQGYNRSGTREQIITPDTMTVSGNSLRIQIPEEISVTKIKYGWAPYPEVNLINEAGLPAWPFKIELPGNF